MTYKRKRHDGQISCLKSKSYPTRLLFFDTETTNKYNTNLQSQQVLRLGVAHYVQLSPTLERLKDIQHVFKSWTEFIDILESYATSGRKLSVYAHNIAFDIMVLNLPLLLLAHGYDVQPPIINGMVFLWKVKKERRTIEFINTGNYVPMSLSKLGHDIGIEKTEVEFSSVDDNTLLAYCNNDVIIIKEFILRYISFIIENDLGSVKNTLASQAFTTYRYKFIQDKIHVHNNKKVLELERKAYKGGRTEAFKLGDFNSQHYYYLDINSMYPHAMINEKLPCCLLNTMDNPSIAFVQSLMKTFYIIADCDVNIDVPYLGVKYDAKQYPITNSDIKPSHGKLIFPVGQFNTALHHDELAYAMEHNHITKINFIAVYKRGELFTNYVNYFMSKKIESKENGNGTEYLMSKLLLNSLYGKFGQTYKNMLCIANDIKLPNGIMTVFSTKSDKSFNDFVWYGKLYRNFNDGEAYYSCPSIAGAITARSRMLMWSYVEQLHIDNLWYMDTDSLFTTKQGVENLREYLHDSQLGMMKIEDFSNHLTIRGCKDYTFNNTRKTKGVPKNAIWLNENCAIYDQFEGFKQWLNRGGDGNPLIFKYTKFKNSDYDKRVLCEDNINTTPFVLSLT